MKKYFISIIFICAPFIIFAMFGIYWAGNRWMHAWAVGHSLENATLVIAACVFVLLCSIGLLLSRNWARLTYIGMMALGVGLSVACIISPFIAFSFDQGHELTVPMYFLVLFFLIPIIFGIMVAAFFSWAFVKLQSEEIKQRFTEKISTLNNTAH